MSNTVEPELVESIENHVTFYSYGWMNKNTGGLVGSDLMLLPQDERMVFSFESSPLSFRKRLTNLFFPNTYREVEVALSKYHISEMTDSFINWLHPPDEIDIVDDHIPDPTS